MSTYVICVIAVDGFHRWSGAFERVNYLRNRHRHVFQIKITFEVHDNDREIEIIDTQNQIKSYLYKKYSDKTCEPLECDFGNMSCEDIACDILNSFEAHSVEVTEDGFGGALVVR